MAFDNELEAFKSLNLGELACHYGYAIDKKDSSRSCLAMRHADGDKIIIASGEDNHAVFFSLKNNVNGSVIKHCACIQIHLNLIVLIIM